jgi:hypothetical protein
MKELIGDLFSQRCDAICITTNGVRKQDGRAVMGAGIAKAAATRWPWLPAILGQHLFLQGNLTSVLFNPKYPAEDNFNIVVPYAIVSLPTKNNWRDSSDLNLIEASVKRLVQICSSEGWKRVCLSRPGCGHGNLDWSSQVKPLIQPLLDDRFCVVDNK